MRLKLRMWGSCRSQGQNVAECRRMGYLTMSRIGSSTSWKPYTSTRRTTVDLKRDGLYNDYVFVLKKEFSASKLFWKSWEGA